MGVYSEGKEIVRDIVKLAQGISDMDLKNKILELQSLFYDLNDENRSLRIELEKLKNIQILENELKYRNGVYTKGNDTEEVYCSVCWDRDKKLTRVRKIDDDDRETVMFHCGVCMQWRPSDIPYEV